MLCAAAALREFAGQRRPRGSAYAAAFVLAFALWSAFVRYSVGWALIFALVATGTMAPGNSSSSAPVQVSEPGEAEIRPTRGRPRWLLSLGAAAVPVLSGFGYRLCLALIPGCGDQDSTGWMLTFVPLVMVAGSVAWLQSRAVGKGPEATAAAVLAAGFVAALACVVAFLMWFGANHCGE